MSVVDGRSVSGGWTERQGWVSVSGVSMVTPCVWSVFSCKNSKSWCIMSSNVKILILNLQSEKNKKKHGIYCSGV